MYESVYLLIHFVKLETVSMRLFLLPEQLKQVESAQMVIITNKLVKFVTFSSLPLTGLDGALWALYELHLCLMKDGTPKLIGKMFCLEERNRGWAWRACSTISTMRTRVLII